MSGGQTNINGMNGKDDQGRKKIPRYSRTSIQDPKFVKKTNLTKGSILNYLTKVPGYTKSQESKSSSTRDESVQSESLRERSPSPDIEYIGTFPSTTTKSNLSGMSKVKEEVVIDDEVLAIPIIISVNDSSNNNTAVLTPIQANLPPLQMTTDESSNGIKIKSIASEGKSNKNKSTSSNSSNNGIIITNVRSLQSPENDLHHEDHSSLSASAHMVSPKRKVINTMTPSQQKARADENFEEKENDEIPKSTSESNNNNNNNNNSSHSSEFIQNVTDCDQEDEVVVMPLSPETNITTTTDASNLKQCRVISPKHDKSNSNPNLLEFLHTNTQKKDTVMKKDEKNVPSPIRKKVIEVPPPSAHRIHESKTPAPRRRNSSESSSSASKRRKVEPVFEFASLIEKRRFKEAFMESIPKLKNSEFFPFPSSDQLSAILHNCVFARVARELSNLAITFLELLVQVTPLSLETYDVYIEAFNDMFTVISSDNSIMVTQLLNDMKDDFKKKPEEKHKLKLFKVLSALIEKDFEFYSNLDAQNRVKLRQPMVARIMAPKELYLLKFNCNWQIFIERIIEWCPESEEAQLGMKWIAMIANYYKKTRHLADSFNSLRDDVVQNLTKRDDRDLGLGFIKLLKFNQSFSLDVCTNLIRNRLSMGEDDETMRKILYELSANIPTQNASTTSHTTSVMDWSPSLSSTSSSLSESDKEFLKFILYANIKGETRLHLACGKKKDFKFQGRKMGYALILRRMKEAKVGNINCKDHAENTLLHDVVYNGYSDVMQSVWEFFTNKDYPVGPWRVNLLAQNDKGMTPFHLAVENKSISCITSLLMMSQVLNCQSEVLRIRNSAGKTPEDLLNPNDPDYEDIKKIIQENSHAGTKKRRTKYAGVELPDSTLCLFEGSPHFQALLVYWRELYDCVNPRILPNINNMQVNDMMENIHESDSDEVIIL